MSMLFHEDNDAVLQTAALRDFASRGIAGNSLMQRCWRGERAAIEAVHMGFWPFVSDFEQAIDQRTLPRKPLKDRFGSEVFGEKFLALAGEVREMRREEGSHAAHWKKDAACFGVADLGASPVLPGVARLLEEARNPDQARFFAFLAATEFVAEEFAAYQLTSPDFARLSTRNRWVWGVVHTIPHDDGPSHLEIDLDLARAYHDAAKPEAIIQMVLECFALFAQATDEIEAALAPAQLMAAE
jgi:hypothetical protein